MAPEQAQVSSIEFQPILKKKLEIAKKCEICSQSNFSREKKPKMVAEIVFEAGNGIRTDILG